MVSRKPRPVNKNKGTGPRKPGIRDWPIWEGRFTDLGDRPGEYFRYRFEGGPQDGQTGEYGPSRGTPGSHRIGDSWPGREVERKSIAGSRDEYISVRADYRIKRREGFGRRTVLVMAFEGLTEYQINTNQK